MSEWIETTLGDVAAEVTVGHVGPMAMHYQESGIPFLRSQNVLEHRLDLNDVKFVSPEFHARLEKSRLRPGDVITVRTGKPGTTSIVPDSLIEANCSDLVITRPGPDLDARWLSYYMNSTGAQYVSSELVGAVQQHFNVGSAKKMTLRMPPLWEQQAIAEVLGALDDKIAANTKLAATVESLGAAKIRAMGINDEPMHGSVALDTLLDFNPRRALDSDSATLIDMQALPTSEPLIRKWSEGPKRGGSRFINGDTLLARITPCLENRKTGFVDFLDDGEVGIGSTEFIVVRSREGLPLGLSYFVATSNRFRDFAIQNMVGTSGRQRVAAADVARFELNPIDHSDLIAFGEWADQNLRLLGSLRNENTVLAATRDALLPQLMSGKLRVKDAEIMVSAVV